MSKIPLRKIRIKRTTHTIHILVSDERLPNNCDDVLAGSCLVHHVRVETDRCFCLYEAITVVLLTNNRGLEDFYFIWSLASLIVSAAG